MKRALFLLLGVFGIFALIAMFSSRPQDPLFHGQPESVWLKNIRYGVTLRDSESKEQVERWLEFGPEGLRVLGRGLRAPGRTYRKLHRWMAGKLSGSTRLLPAPKPDDTRGIRMNILDLLARMGTNAWAATPDVARALDDESPEVRAIAVTFFTHPENDQALLNHLPARQKRRLVRQFIRGLEEQGYYWPLRNNCAIALRYYPEEGPTIAPALVKALKDPQPHVRLHAAEALNLVAPTVGKNANAVAVVTNVLTDPDGQIAWLAAGILRDFQKQPEIAIPALLNALRNTNTLVACSAVWTLEWAFQKHAAEVLPALQEAAQRKDNVAGYARSALKHFERDAGPRPIPKQ